MVENPHEAFAGRKLSLFWIGSYAIAAWLLIGGIVLLICAD